MDFVWIAAVGALWVVTVELVAGLHRLDAPRGERS